MAQNVRTKGILPSIDGERQGASDKAHDKPYFLKGDELDRRADSQARMFTHDSIARNAYRTAYKRGYLYGNVEPDEDEEETPEQAESIFDLVLDPEPKKKRRRQERKEVKANGRQKHHANH